jgi:hypothetical protein
VDSPQIFERFSYSVKDVRSLYPCRIRGLRCLRIGRFCWMHSLRSGGSCGTSPACPGHAGECQPRGRAFQAHPPENLQTFISHLRRPDLIHSKRFREPLTLLESILTGCPHLVENTQVQLLQIQYLRVFSPQVLYIQHLRENTGGRVSPGFRTAGG